MTRKLEKGEPLKVGDVIETNCNEGKIVRIKNAGCNHVIYHVEWIERNDTYAENDPAWVQVRDTCAITREEPEGKWRVGTCGDGVERVCDQAGIAPNPQFVVNTLNDQAATIDRLKKVMLECADLLTDGTSYKPAMQVFKRLSQEASK